MGYEHIIRNTVPWREPSKTECGRSLDDVAKLITLDQAKAKVEREGKQRALYSMCQTCINAVNRNPQWEQNPAEVLHRTYQSWEPSPDDRRELDAIAALIATHRDEFNALVAGMGAAVDLRDRRKAR